MCRMLGSTVWSQFFSQFHCRRIFGAIGAFQGEFGVNGELSLAKEVVYRSVRPYNSPRKPQIPPSLPPQQCGQSRLISIDGPRGHFFSKLKPGQT